MKKIKDSISRIIYPSDIFLLEKHESFAYERFAYNAMKTGISALKDKHNNSQFDVDMTDDSSININFSIGRFINEQGYVIKTSAYTPPLLFVFCKHFENVFNDKDVLISYIKNPKKFEGDIKEFADMVINSFVDNTHNIISDWISDLYRKFNIDFNTLYSSVSEYYDLCCKVITYHEVAHAYVGQLYFANHISKEDARAFEYAADLISAEWFYNKYVRNTPNTKEYRELRGIKTYGECLTTNYHFAIKTYFMLLLFMGISNALSNDGRVSLDGGTMHPNSLSRILMQRSHFDTYCISNFVEVFTSEYMKKSDNYFSIYRDLFINVGIINQSDAKYLSNIEDDINDLKSIIKSYNIESLKMLLNFNVSGK